MPRLKCDFKKHCSDNSDEKICRLVLLGDGYQRFKPPQPGVRQGLSLGGYFIPPITP